MYSERVGDLVIQLRREIGAPAMPYTGGAWVGPSGRTMYFTQQNPQHIDRIYMTTRANL